VRVYLTPPFAPRPNPRPPPVRSEREAPRALDARPVLPPAAIKKIPEAHYFPMGVTKEMTTSRQPLLLVGGGAAPEARALDHRRHPHRPLRPDERPRQRQRRGRARRPAQGTCLACSTTEGGAGRRCEVCEPVGASATLNVDEEEEEEGEAAPVKQSEAESEAESEKEESYEGGEEDEGADEL
jgi:hypothetical protein